MTRLLSRQVRHRKHAARDDAHRAPRSAAPAVHERVAVDGLHFRRGNSRFRVNGVTYGPFAPCENGIRFPAEDTVRRDFAQMQQIGINAIRLYHMPPTWLLE